MYVVEKGNDLQYDLICLNNTLGFQDYEIRASPIFALSEENACSSDLKTS